MSIEDRFAVRLQAYHDGELSWLGRRAVERRLARDPGARRELESLRALSSLVAETEVEVATPDLWDAVALRLSAADAQREPVATATFLDRLRDGPRWVAAGLATATAGLALAIGLNLGEPLPGGALRSLDASGPVMVLKDDREATIIWLLDAAPESASRRTGRV